MVETYLTDENASSNNGHWLASPYRSSTSVSFLFNYAKLDGYDCSNKAGIRPVVCLKENVKLEKIGDYLYKIVE